MWSQASTTTEKGLIGLSPGAIWMRFMFVYRDEEERQNLITEALITRINTREASTLVFSTVAASASLIFLAAIFQGNISPEWKEPMKWTGFLFSLLGPIYREKSRFTLLTELIIKDSEPD
jgi:hypothetical protein